MWLACILILSHSFKLSCHTQQECTSVKPFGNAGIGTQIANMRFSWLSAAVCFHAHSSTNTFWHVLFIFSFGGNCLTWSQQHIGVYLAVASSRSSIFVVFNCILVPLLQINALLAFVSIECFQSHDASSTFFSIVSMVVLEFACFPWVCWSPPQILTLKVNLRQ